MKDKLEKDKKEEKEKKECGGDPGSKLQSVPLPAAPSPSSCCNAPPVLYTLCQRVILSYSVFFYISSLPRPATTTLKYLHQHLLGGGLVAGAVELHGGE